MHQSIVHACIATRTDTHVHEPTSLAPQDRKHGCITCHWSSSGCEECRADYGLGLAVSFYPHNWSSFILEGTATSLLTEHRIVFLVLSQHPFVFGG